MADEQLDSQEIAKQAEAIASKKVEELQQNLIKSLTGEKSRYGETGPGSWDKLHDDIVGEAVPKAVEEAEKRILSKINADKKADEDRRNLTLQQQQEQTKQEWQDLTSQWREAVSDGLLPPISAGVQEKLDKGVVYSALSPEEQQDAGLIAYNRAVQLHLEKRKAGQSSSLYRTVQKYYNQQPEGMNAPVFGGSTAAQPQKETYTYEELHAGTKKTFRNRFR